MSAGPTSINLPSGPPREGEHDTPSPQACGQSHHRSSYGEEAVPSAPSTPREGTGQETPLPLPYQPSRTADTVAGAAAYGSCRRVPARRPLTRRRVTGTATHTTSCSAGPTRLRYSETTALRCKGRGGPRPTVDGRLAIRPPTRASGHALGSRLYVLCHASVTGVDPSRRALHAHEPLTVSSA